MASSARLLPLRTSFGGSGVTSTKPYTYDELLAAVSAALRIRLPNPNRLLLAGPHLGLLASIKVALESCYAAEIATTVAQLHDLTSVPPAVVILDATQPTFHLLGMLNVLRARAARSSVIAVVEVGRPTASELATFPLTALFRRPVPFRDLLVSIIPVARPEAAFTPSRYSAHVSRLVDFVGGNYPSGLTVTTLAEKVGLSEGHLAHVFKDELGFSVKEYVTRVRLEVAKCMLRDTDRKLASIADAVGFTDASHLSRLFRQYAGFRPGQYRRSAPSA